MATKDISANRVDVKKNLDVLFALELKIAKVTPTLLQIETRDRFLHFLTGEPHSTTWLWKEPSGRNAGYMTLIDKPDEELLEVLAIRVDPGLQGLGYGRKMMGFSERLAAELGRKKVMLATSPENTKALGFYKRLGYRIIKKAENYYGDGTPRYLLEKELP